MTTESISFIAVFERYILYSEALSQYLGLEEEDKKIVEPYILQLKESWQEELKQIKMNVKSISILKGTK